MVQVENEIGMLPIARERGAVADKLFARRRAAGADARARRKREQARARAARLAGRRTARRHPALGRRCSATTSGRQEVFTAWHYARFVEALVKAGKTALRPADVRERRAQPHRPQARRISERWPAAASDRCVEGRRADDSTSSRPTSTSRTSRSSPRAIDRADNVLFIPEANNATNPQGPRMRFYAFGELDSFGFSPFSIESLGDAPNALSQSYAVLEAAVRRCFSTHRGNGRIGGLSRHDHGRRHRD